MSESIENIKVGEFFKWPGYWDGFVFLRIGSDSEDVVKFTCVKRPVLPKINNPSIELGNYPLGRVWNYNLKDSYIKNILKVEKEDY